MTNYKQLLPHLSQWRDLLDEVAHGYDTNCNESMNNLTAWIAPKNKCYSGMGSLRTRVACAVAIQTFKH